MSASTEKKNRQLAREAGTDKKLLAAQEEAKKRAASRRRWTFGTIVVVVFIALILFLNSGFFHSGTKAVVIGDESYSPAELNYYYASQFNSWYSTYGSYASLFGLDTTNGIAGLATQIQNEETGATWKDYFMESAFTALIQEQALLDYAEENGIELDETELAEIDEQFETLKETAKGYGYSKLDNYFAAMFGEGVDEELVYDATLRNSLASKAYLGKYNSFEYTDEELEEYYKGLNGESDMFGYVYYYLAAETVTTTAEDGTESSAVTDETLAAAKETADAILDAFNGEAAQIPEETEDAESAAETEDAEPAAETEELSKFAAQDAETASIEARLNAAIAAQGIDATATQTNSAGSSLGDYKEWLMMSERRAGDSTAIEASSGNGYYIVVYLGRNDNHYNMAQVRHILIKAEAGEDGSYTDEAKAAALASAEDILAQWKAGDATEDSFAALAEEYSEDTGSNTNGGLYDSVYQGQMVDEFNNFCFEGHEHGDTAIVYGESGSYAGYHVMYYVGEGELYSNYIADNGLKNEALNTWITELTEGMEAVKGFGYRFTN